MSVTKGAPGPSAFDRRIGIRIFLLALAVRLVYVAETFGTVVQDVLLIDSGTYDRFARLILAGGFKGELVYSMNVLYPYVLAAIYSVTGESPTAAIYVQSFASALNATLIAIIAHAVIDRRTGVLAGVIAAIYGPYVFYAGALLTPTLIDTFGLGALVLLLQHREHRSRVRLLVAGLAIGLMTLGRGNAVLLLPLLLPVLWRWAERPRQALADWALVVVIPVLLVGGVTIRNARVAGDLVPISANVAAFYIGHNPESTGLYVLPEFTRGAAFEDEVEGTRAALSKSVGRELTVAESARHLAGEGLRFARENLDAELRLLLRKLFFFWNKTEAPTNLNYYFAKDFSRLLRALPLHFGILAPLGLCGLVLVWRRARERLLVLLYASVFLLTGLVFFVAAEYRNPITAIVIVFASGALVRIAETVAALFRGSPAEKRTAARTLALSALLVAPLAYATNVSTPLLAQQSLKRVDYLNAGTVLQSEGELERARAMYDRALEIDPAFGPAYAGLARIEHALGNELEAVRLQSLAARYAVGGQYRDEGTDAADALLFEVTAHYSAGEYEEALQGFEALRDAHVSAGRTADALRMANNVGLCLYKLGRLDEAATTFHDVLARDSTYVFAYTNLARVAAARDDWALGDSLYRRALELAPQNPRVVEGWQRFQERLPE